MKTQADIYNFMNSKSLCVISSLSADGSPQSALVGFGQTEYMQVVFGTSIQSRKAHNISVDSRVSMVIGGDGPITVQHEGTAQQLEGEEAKKYSEIYFQKNPKARKHNDDPNQRWFVIEPSWVRYTDLSVYPWDVTELDLGK